MKKILWLVAVLGAFSAASLADAPPPASPEPTGLALILARYAGTYNVDETSFDTQYSRASSRQYLILRACTQTGAVLDCKLTAGGVLQGEQRFTWDAAAGVFHVDMDIGGRTQPPLTLTVQGETWTFLQPIQDATGAPMQYRIQRHYRTPTEVSYNAGFSRNGTDWVIMTRGTEIRAADVK